MKISKRFVKITASLLGLSLIMTLLGILLYFIIPNDTWPNKRVSYNLVENNQLEEHWSRSNLFAPSETPMAAAKKKIFVVGTFNRPGNTVVLAFDGTTGNLLWKSRKPDSHSLTGLFATSSALYAGSIGSGRITAYDLDTGQILWSKRMPGARYIRRFQVVENLIYVVSSSGKHLVEAHTGDVLYTFTGTPSQTTLRGMVEELALPSLSQIELEYFDDATFTEGVKIIKSGDDVQAHDRQTGIRLWEIEGVISNVTIAAETVYLLTVDRKLLGLDLYSGKTVALAQFKPSSIDSDTVVNSFATAYYVAVDEDAKLLYAFLGNGGQLFAFKIDS